MTVLSTGVIENRKRQVTSLAISVSNEANLNATAQVEVYLVPTLGVSNAEVYFLNAFSLNPFSTTDSIVTFDNVYANFDHFGVRVITGGEGADNIVVTVTGLDSSANRIFEIFPGELGPGIPGPPGPPGTPVLTGIGEPTCAIGNLGDIYIDLSTGNTFYKLSQPVPPPVRPIPAPTGITIPVGSTQTYTTIDAALAAANPGDRLLLDAETFTITSTINVNTPVTIEGQGIGLTIVTTTLNTVNTMFNVTVSNVVFQNMSIVQNFPQVLSIETVISLNNLSATGIYVDRCEISVCELGISVKVTEFQITNCNFTYAPLASRPNGYYYIIISSTSGESIIDNNTFVSDAGNSNCRFIIITNIAVNSGTLQGNLVVNNNTQLVSPFTLRHLLVIEEFIGADFGLYFINNTTINEGNVPVLLFNANLNIFKFIATYGNSVQNTAGKGIIGIDSSYIGTTNIFSSGNTIANEFFTSGWASATVPSSFIVGYNTTAIPTDPNLPLNNCYWLMLIS
ncbi:collagen-like protein [Paenibacillus silvae]|uniref:collagen-like protein n=1 Tax=Paenibacillus silvae TaxID=1325358 RepID=UPI0020066C44|nr:collagen-like protein [Paenibacillus silvae]